MYQRRVEFSITPGKADQFEAWADKFAQDKKKTGGYLGETLLQRYTNPSNYTVMVRWESFEANSAYFRSGQFKLFQTANPPDGWQPSGRSEAYDAVLEVNADGFADAPGNCEVLQDILLTRGPASIPEFESRVQEIGETVRKNVKGFRSLRLRRSLSGPFSYIIIGIFEDLAASQSVLKNFSVTDGKSLVEITGAPVEWETYRVVKRTQ